MARIIHAKHVPEGRTVAIPDEDYLGARLELERDLLSNMLWGLQRRKLRNARHGSDGKHQQAPRAAQARECSRHSVQAPDVAEGEEA